MLYQLSYSRLSGGYYIITAVQPQLFFQDQGTGPAVIIIHGLFGSLDNWASISKRLSEHFRVITIDLRNHGRSFHSPVHRYPDMAQDVAALIEFLNLDRVSIVGHSMGGKVAIQFAADFPNLVDRVVVVDIFPIEYPPHHDDIFAGLTAVDLGQVRRRGEAEAMMMPFVRDSALRLFLLKSLAFDPDGRAFWRFNLDAVMSEYAYIVGDVTVCAMIDSPTLFIMGGDSEYRVQQGEDAVNTRFTSVDIRVIPNAGHWVHAQYPDEVVQMVFSHFGG